jgi:hypothetical protein
VRCSLATIVAAALLVAPPAAVNSRVERGSGITGEAGAIDGRSRLAHVMYQTRNHAKKNSAANCCRNERAGEIPSAFNMPSV